MKKSIPWLAVTIVLVIIFGTIYAAVQQSQRSAANFPQIEIAEDTATQLNNGQIPSELTKVPAVDMAHSLAPFVIIYDKQGRVVSGTGFVNNHVPTAPIGVLSAANSKTYNAVTWQPTSDTRIASVTVAASNYYVLSGRSLKEVERNEDKTFRLSLLGGIVSIAVVGLANFAMLALPRKF